jgi:superfamily II DNA or RNA helicase
MAERIIYEKIASDIDYETLSSQWQYNGSLMSFFSDKKKLYDYQIDALKNASKFLWKFYSYYYEYPKYNDYKNFIEAKKKLYNDIKSINKDVENLGLSSKDNSVINEVSNFYNYDEKNGYKRIHFFNFVNRIGFWMATGSGKTLVIVKLIELLDYFINNNLIPKNDILILTYRDDLIDQIRDHINEYNNYHNKKIDLYDLRDYDKVKYGSILVNRENISVFIYRSDLISDETKEKELSYKDIENDGKWYIILDEAHKGNKEDSKRQVFYSFLTRFGFLFNFSATFTDPWDVVTTVYNFNLDRFIAKGYGKNVYLSQKDIDIKKFDYEKERVILKAFILLTASKIAREKILQLNNELSYHNPLMVIYGNSVNTDEADLKIVFKVIENISKNIKPVNFDSAKKDILDELSKHPRYIFAHEEFILSEEIIKEIKIDDILKYVFNSDSFGSIEVISIPKNNEELVFKVKSSDKPFAMIKIGDIKEWLKQQFKDYEINESYDNKSYFKDINNIDNTINVLLGSRSFYEGWDSNRPNVMMFINIGTGDSKKYVLQSIGRGERIEPMRNERKRLRFLANERIDAKESYNKINRNYISLIESLFVFGTSSENVKDILDAIKFEREKTGQIIELKKNKDIYDKDLLIPVYKLEDKPKIDEIPKFSGNFNLLDSYIKWLGSDKLLYAIYSDYIQPEDISRLKTYLKEDNFDKNNEGNAFLQMIDLIGHVNITLENFAEFKNLENEIIHFTQISALLTETELDALKREINKAVGVSNQEEKLKQLTEKFKNGKITSEEFQKEVKKIDWFGAEDFRKDQYTIKIKNIKSHYYVPVMIAEDSKEDFINHIIKEDSERKFIESLEDYTRKNELDVDYWFFSKIDQATDKVYIPYYNKKNNKQEKFYPDFIFWIKKNNDYHIVFVDPKSTSYTDYEYKVDGYRQNFEENGNPKQFNYKKDLNIYVHLFLFTDDKNKLPKGYKRYWYDNPKMIFDLVNINTT